MLYYYQRINICITAMNYLLLLLETEQVSKLIKKRMLFFESFTSITSKGFI